MDNKPVFLVDEQDIFVLIDDRNVLGSFEECVFFLGIFLAEKFIGKIQLQHISLGKSGGYLTALAVELDVFRADTFIHCALGQLGCGFLYEFVHTLPCVVGVYDVFFHWLVSSL